MTACAHVLRAHMPYKDDVPYRELILQELTVIVYSSVLFALLRTPELADQA